MNKEKINKKADNIIDEAEGIKEEVKEKKGKVRGDPIIDINF